MNMKKILIWSGIAGGVFVVLVGVIFIVLTYLGPVDENQQMAVTIGNNAITSKALTDKQLTVDSLSALVNNMKSGQFFSRLVVDSLQEQLLFKDGLIEGYKKTINQLNDVLLAANKQAVNIKELAKTYETMKVDEISPILKNVDDETVIAIYKNMSSRNRKNIMKALSNERAATITKRLAKVMEG